MFGLCERIRELQENLEGLRKAVKRERAHSQNLEARGTGPVHISSRPRRVLEGHSGGVHAMHWAGDGKHLATVSQDGRLVIWDATTASQAGCVALSSCWMMTCAFEQSSDRLLATGGLDKTCSIYTLQGPVGPPAAAEPARRLSDHSGYISCCRFIGPERLVTSSGDGSCRYWDVEGRRCEAVLRGHRSDVRAVSVSPHDPMLVASASCDGTAKLWDLRTSQCVATYPHHVEISAVAFFPSGHALATCSDDGACRLMDARFPQTELGRFEREAGVAATDLAFSVSGRWLFSGYEDGQWLAWDTLEDALHRQHQHQQDEEGGRRLPSLAVRAHGQRVSGLGVNRQGEALATASGDGTAKVWA